MGLLVPCGHYEVSSLTHVRRVASLTPPAVPLWPPSLTLKAQACLGVLAPPVSTSHGEDGICKLCTMKCTLALQIFASPFANTLCPPSPHQDVV